MENNKLPSVFTISMFPSVSLDNEILLNSLLNVLEQIEQLIPTQWGPNEMTRLTYNKSDVLERVLASPFKDTEIYLHRTENLKYEGSFSLGYSFRSFLHFKFNSMPRTLWPLLFELSDSIAQIVKPRYGNTHIFWPSTVPWKTDQQRLHRWMNFCAQPAPVNFGPVGPLGLGHRTYFGEDIVELIGESSLLNTPAIVSENEWGGIQIDVVKEPWLSTPDQLLSAWLQSMNYLQETEVLAIPNFNLKDNRTVQFTVGDK
ncbi:hypothetical protein [Paenibacillus arenosi]|uniref:DUF3396 domain-containing protein n=1 Tax=Paenibacillus arenosi TaxID=2774142 RepID=A0ABR9AXQ0_9BACL|nr:hypothetical protein [Paenibacillus arenosi]MBD8498792.1 hypothetical protein [Paenibacillus arenosi]